MFTFFFMIFQKFNKKNAWYNYSNLVNYLLLSYLEYPQYLPPRCLSARVVAQKIVRPTWHDTKDCEAHMTWHKRLWGPHDMTQKIVRPTWHDSKDCEAHMTWPYVIDIDLILFTPLYKSNPYSTINIKLHFICRVHKPMLRYKKPW